MRLSFSATLSISPKSSFSGWRDKGCRWKSQLSSVKSNHFLTYLMAVLRKALNSSLAVFASDGGRRWSFSFVHRTHHLSSESTCPWKTSWWHTNQQMLWHLFHDSSPPLQRGREYYIEKINLNNISFLLQLFCIHVQVQLNPQVPWTVNSKTH